MVRRPVLGTEPGAALLGGITADDRVMIKDNHRALWARESGTTALAAAVKASRDAYPDLAIEVERSLKTLRSRIGSPGLFGQSNGR